MRYVEPVFRAAMLALIVAFGSTAVVGAVEECPSCECEERSFGAVAKETFCGGSEMQTLFSGGEEAMDECEDYCAGLH